MSSVQKYVVKKDTYENTERNFFRKGKRFSTFIGISKSKFSKQKYKSRN